MVPCLVNFPLAGSISPCLGQARQVLCMLLQIISDNCGIFTTQARGVDKDVYGSNHPSGRIGRRLTLTVASIMLLGDQMPCVAPGTTVGDALVELTRKGTGCLLVVQPGCVASVEARRTTLLCGIFTDGDLRRALQNHGGQLMGMAIDEVMTCTPRTCCPSALAVDALRVCGWMCGCVCWLQVVVVRFDHSYALVTGDGDSAQGGCIACGGCRASTSGARDIACTCERRLVTNTFYGV